MSFAPTVDGSTPFRSHTDNCISTEKRFCVFEELIESTVMALKAELLEQTKIIAESKQELCKLARENLHLTAHLTEREEKFSLWSN